MPVAGSGPEELLGMVRHGHHGIEAFFFCLKNNKAIPNE